MSKVEHLRRNTSLNDHIKTHLDTSLYIPSRPYRDAYIHSHDIAPKKTSLYTSKVGYVEKPLYMTIFKPV